MPRQPKSAAKSLALCSPLAIVPLLVVFLCGCVGDHGNRLVLPDDHVRKAPLQWAETPAEIAPLASTPTLQEAVSRLQSEVSESSNANQQSISGLGLNIGKLAERMDVALAKITVDVATQVRADLEVAFKAQVELHNKIETKLDSEIELNTRLRARVDALVQAQAGIGNRLENFQQRVSAGRDSMITTTFSDEFRRTLEKAFSTYAVIVAIGAGAVVLLTVISGVLIGRVLVGSRRRADTRAAELFKIVFNREVPR